MDDYGQVNNAKWQQQGSHTRLRECHFVSNGAAHLDLTDDILQCFIVARGNRSGNSDYSPMPISMGAKTWWLKYIILGRITAG